MKSLDFLKATHAAAVYIGREAPLIVGQMLVNDIKENFDKEAFEKNPWPDLKPETIKRKTRRNGSTPKKLVDKGNLVASIDYNADFNTVSVGAMNERTSKYAGTHNEGLHAGSGAGFTMPQRQFMPIPGQPLPAHLEQKINDQLEHDLNQIFNKQ